MSKINHRRKDSWKIKIRKPVSIRPSKIMDATKYERHRMKQKLHDFIKEDLNDTSQK